MRKGAIGQKPGEGVFFLLLHHGGFLRVCYWLFTAEDPFGYAVEWMLKPR